MRRKPSENPAAKPKVTMPESSRPWTPQEFRALGLALHGGAHGWQSALARRLGVSDRTVRRWASGETSISSRIQSEVMALAGSTDLSESVSHRDEWIVGDGQPLEGGRRHEYVIHAWPPRFICRVVMVDEDSGKPAIDEGEADLLTGIVYQADPTTMLCEFQWIDYPPSGEKFLTDLLESAVGALESSGDY